MKLRLPRSVILALLLSLYLPADAVDSCEIEGSKFPYYSKDQSLINCTEDINKPDTTFFLSGSGVAHICRDSTCTCAAWYAPDETEYENMTVIAKHGAIYVNESELCNAEFDIKESAESDTYGVPQIIINHSSMWDGSELKLRSEGNGIKTTLRNLTLGMYTNVYSWAYNSPDQVKEAKKTWTEEELAAYRSYGHFGILNIEGLTYTPTETVLNESYPLIYSDGEIYLNTTGTYSYNCTGTITLQTIHTVTIGENPEPDEKIHELTGFSRLVIDIAPFPDGDDDEDNDDEVICDDNTWNVNNLDIINADVTINAAEGRVQAGILKGTGSSSITAKQLYLSSFDGGALTADSSGLLEVAGDITATGDISLNSTAASVSVGGALSAPNGKLVLKAEKKISDSGSTDITHRANSIQLQSYGEIAVKGTLCASTVLVTANDNLTLGAVGTQTNLAGEASIASTYGDIVMGSFEGTTLSVTSTAGNGSITIGEVYATSQLTEEEDFNAVHLLCDTALTVNGSVTSLSTTGVARLHSYDDKLSVGGSLNVAGASVLKAKSGISIGGDIYGDVTASTETGTLSVTGQIGSSLVPVATASLTAASGSASLGDINVKTLTVTAPQGITIGGVLNVVDAAVLTSTGDISVSGNVFGTVEATSTGGAIQLMSAVGLQDEAAGDISLTPGEGQDVSLGSFCGNSLTVSKAGTITIGRFQSTGAKDGYTAQLSGTSLTLTAELVRSVDTTGVFKATTTEGSMSFAGRVSAYTLILTSAADMTFGGSLKPASQAILHAAGAISVAGSADLNNASTVRAAAMTFSSGVTAAGAVIGGPEAAKAQVSLGGDMVLSGADILGVTKKSELTADVAANGHDVTLTDTTLTGSVSEAGTVTLENTTIDGSNISAASVTVNSDLTATGVIISVGDSGVDLTNHKLTLTNSTVSGTVSEVTALKLDNADISSLEPDAFDPLECLVTAGSSVIGGDSLELKVSKLELNGGRLTLGTETAHGGTITVNTALTVTARTVLNSNLALEDGVTVTLASGTSINLGCTLTLYGKTSFTRSSPLAPQQAVTLMTGVDELVTDSDVWTTDPSNDKISYTYLSETSDTTDGTYTYTTGASGGDLLIAYNSADGSMLLMPEPATATLSMLALAGLCSRRRRF